LVVAGILDIPEIKQRTGVARILAKVLHQEGTGTLEVLLIDLVFCLVSL
jgi:hypothetical protein